MLEATHLTGGLRRRRENNFDSSIVKALRGNANFFNPTPSSPLNIAAGRLTFDTATFTNGGAPGFSDVGGLTVTGNRHRLKSH